MDCAYVVPYEQNIPRNFTQAVTCAQSVALITASYLTDPVCKSREYFVRSRMLEDLPTASPRVRDFMGLVSTLPGCSFLNEDEYAKSFEFYCLRAASAAFAAVSSITAPVGIGLRALVGNFSFGPLHYRGTFPEKEREGNQFSHFLRNVCGVEGGYDIEEGAQMPIRDDLNYCGSDRLDRLIDQFLNIDPDVLCLNEVFDINDAHYIANALKHRYAHFVFHCGPRSVGPNSGLFFASKFAVSDHQFKPFPKEMLVENAKQCEKGVLLVDLRDSEGEIATIALTHAQHSDEVRHGSLEEKIARAHELKFIRDLVSSKKNVVLTGDLNMDDDEMKEPQNREFYELFAKTTSYILPNGREEFTWGGDEWYVNYGNRTADWPTIPTSSYRSEPRKVSTGCNLDHTMVFKKNMSVNSTLVVDPNPYDPKSISRESLSDHRGVLSTIAF